MRQPHVQYRASPLLSNRVYGFGQGWIQLFGPANDPREGSAGGGRDSRIIGRRVEADADVLIPAGGAGSVSVRVNRQRRELRGLPPAIVVDDLQERRLIAPRDPMNRRRDGEHI